MFPVHGLLARWDKTFSSCGCWFRTIYLLLWMFHALPHCVLAVCFHSILLLLLLLLDPSWCVVVVILTVEHCWLDNLVLTVFILPIPRHCCVVYTLGLMIDLTPCIDTCPQAPTHLTFTHGITVLVDCCGPGPDPNPTPVIWRLPLHCCLFFPYYPHYIIPKLLNYWHTHCIPPVGSSIPLPVDWDSCCIIYSDYSCWLVWLVGLFVWHVYCCCYCCIGIDYRWTVTLWRWLCPVRHYMTPIAPIVSVIDLFRTFPYPIVFGYSITYHYCYCLVVLFKHWTWDIDPHPFTLLLFVIYYIVVLPVVDCCYLLFPFTLTLLLIIGTNTLLVLDFINVNNGSGVILSVSVVNY